MCHCKTSLVIFLIRNSCPALFSQGEIKYRVPRTLLEINNENARELSLYSYRIIYQIKNDKAFVLAVVYKRRNLKPEDIEQ